MHEFPARYLANGQPDYLTLSVPKADPLSSPVVVRHGVTWPDVDPVYAARVIRNARTSLLNRLMHDGLLTKEQEAQYRRC